MNEEEDAGAVVVVVARADEGASETVIAERWRVQLQREKEAHGFARQLALPFVEQEQERNACDLVVFEHVGWTVAADVTGVEKQKLGHDDADLMLQQQKQRAQ
jgi:hypothetical protein